MTDRIRLTITVPAETHAVFQRMADVSGQSLGRVMGDWLADTAEGAQIVVKKLQEAREAPKLVMREFRAMAVGLVEEIDATHAELQRDNSWYAGRAEGAASPPPAGRRTGRTAPSSNTGLKSPHRAGAKGAKRA